MEKNLDVSRVYQKIDRENATKFNYSISSILNNLYEAYKTSKITSKEKLEIKNLIFSKSSHVEKIIEDLKKPTLFNSHLKTLKKIIKRTINHSSEKIYNQKNLISSSKTSLKEKISNKLFLNEMSTNEGLNQSLLMDSNESIIFIEKTNQNLFSEEEDDNLSTTLGLELFNQSTNPSTPLNAGKIIKYKKENNFQKPNFKFKIGILKIDNQEKSRSKAF